MFDQTEETLISIYNLLTHAIEAATVVALLLLALVAIGWRTEMRKRRLKFLAIPVTSIVIVLLLQMGLWRGSIAPIQRKMMAEHQRTSALKSADPTAAPELLTVVGEIAPNLTFKDDGRASIRLEQLQGKVVVLNFFGIDCIPCIKELPELQKIYDGYSERDGFQMFGVSAFDTLTAVTVLKNDLNLTFPMCVAERQQLAGWLSSTSIPQTFVIDGNGYIAYQHSGFDDRHAHDTMLNLTRAIDQQLDRTEETPVSDQNSGRTKE